MNYELLITPAAAEEQYVAPQIEIIDIEMDQNILNASGGESEDLPGGGMWN